ARHRRDDLFGEPDGGLVDDEVRGAALHLALHRLHHRGVRVAKQHRPRAEQIVEIAASGHVVQIRAAALTHDELEPGARAMTAEESAGKHARGAVEKIALIAHGWASPRCEEYAMSLSSGALDELLGQREVRGIDHAPLEAKRIDAARRVLGERRHEL